MKVTDMARIYQHTQIGYLLISVLTISMIAIMYLIILYGFNWIPLSVLVFLGISLALFHSLTITIEDEILELKFGVGLIRKKFSLGEVFAARAVKNPWYYGWGIRFTPHGWLYNVSGLHAVELEMKNGKRCRIGTDVPENLEKAVRESIAGKI